MPGTAQLTPFEQQFGIALQHIEMGRLELALLEAPDVHLVERQVRTQAAICYFTCAYELLQRAKDDQRDPTWHFGFVEAQRGLEDARSTA